VNIAGVPRETVAFAAGLHNASETLTWVEIAAVLITVGLGAWSPGLLRTAVKFWCGERADRMDAGDLPGYAEATRIAEGSGRAS
jgi:hypothetical protein